MKILNYNPIDRSNQIKNGDDIELFYVIEIDNIKKDVYLLSNYGRLFNMNKGTELLMTKRYTGHLVSNLQTEDGKTKNIYPHRVIANVFIPKTEEDIKNKNNYILFIDGDKTNMKASNMKWVSLKTIRSLANYSKQNNKLYTLTRSQAHMICIYLEQGMKIKEILNALPFKTTYTVVWNIANGRTWTNVSCLYKIKYSKKKIS